jgi:hypothetical protein
VITWLKGFRSLLEAGGVAGLLAGSTFTAFFAALCCQGNLTCACVDKNKGRNKTIRQFFFFILGIN